MSPTSTEVRPHRQVLAPFQVRTHLSPYAVAEDLSHINTGAKVRSFQGPEELAQALQGCELVVIPAGVPRKPGMTRQDLFNVNAGIVAGLAEACAKNCPNVRAGSVFSLGTKVEHGSLSLRPSRRPSSTSSQTL